MSLLQLQPKLQKKRRTSPGCRHLPPAGNTPAPESTRSSEGSTQSVRKTRVCGGGQRRRRTEEQSWAEGGSANPPAPSVCHIPSPLHILRRAETANHAETNVKINHYDLSCSALACFPLVTFPSHSSSRPISLLPKKNLQTQCLPPQWFPWHRATQQRLYGRPMACEQERGSC